VYYAQALYKSGDYAAANKAALQVRDAAHSGRMIHLQVGDNLVVLVYVCVCGCVCVWLCVCGCVYLCVRVAL
jgi:hypothetical protein